MHAETSVQVGQEKNQIRPSKHSKEKETTNKTMLSPLQKRSTCSMLTFKFSVVLNPNANNSTIGTIEDLIPQQTGKLTIVISSTHEMTTGLRMELTETHHQTITQLFT